MAGSISRSTFLIDGYEFKHAELERMITSDKPRDIGWFPSGAKKTAVNSIVGKFETPSSTDSNPIIMIKRFNVIRSLVTLEQRDFFVLRSLDYREKHKENVAGVRLSIADHDICLKSWPVIATVTKGSAPHNSILSQQNLHDVIEPLYQMKQAQDSWVFEDEEEGTTVSALKIKNEALAAICQEADFKILIQCSRRVSELSASASAGFVIEIKGSASDSKSYDVAYKLNDKEIYTANITQDQRNKLAVTAALIDAKPIAEWAGEVYTVAEYNIKAIEYMTVEGEDSRNLLAADDESFDSAKFATCAYEGKIKHVSDGKERSVNQFKLTFRAQSNDYKANKGDLTTVYFIKYPFPLPLHTESSSQAGQRNQEIGQIYRGNMSGMQNMQLTSLFNHKQEVRYTSIREVLAPYFHSSNDIVMSEAVRPVLEKLDKSTGGRGECFQKMEVMRELHKVKLGDTSLAELAQEPMMTQKLKELDKTATSVTE